MKNLKNIRFKSQSFHPVSLKKSKLANIARRRVEFKVIMKKTVKNCNYGRKYYSSVTGIREREFSLKKSP